MIHFLPDLGAERREPSPEALARLAGLQRALRLVDPHGGGPAPDVDDELDGAWAEASEAVKHCFDLRSERTIAGAAAGLEAILAERAAAREPNDAALRRLADEIRAGLADLTSLVRQPRPAPSPWG
jgi:hypothetical protein